MIIIPCWLRKLGKNLTNFPARELRILTAGWSLNWKTRKIFFKMVFSKLYYGVSWLKNINKKNDDDDNEKRNHQQKNIFSHCFIFRSYNFDLSVHQSIYTSLSMYTIWLSWNARQNTRGMSSKKILIFNSMRKRKEK